MCEKKTKGGNLYIYINSSTFQSLEFLPSLHASKIQINGSALFILISGVGSQSRIMSIVHPFSGSVSDLLYICHTPK